MAQHKGLTNAQAQELLQKFGPNEITAKEPSPFLEFLKWFAKPTSLMIEFAALLSLAAGRLTDALIMAGMLLVNVFISYFHERSAENAIEKLKETVLLKAKVMRDGVETKIDSRLVVLGDIIVVEKGDIVPADCEVLEAENLGLDESFLTGESFPVGKKTRSLLYSASSVKSGEGTCIVTATGPRTYYGKTIELIETSSKSSEIEKEVLRMTKFLIGVGLVSIIIISAYFLLRGSRLIDVLVLATSIAISSFPVAMPTVITIVTSIGILQLSKKSVIVRRIASLEDLSTINLLLTDKTGTLTKNAITVARVVAYSGTEAEVARQALACSDETLDDVIDSAVVSYAKSKGIHKDFKVMEYIPASPESKMSQGTVLMDGRKTVAIKGASQVIASKCGLSGAKKEGFEKEIRGYSNQGYKEIAVAVKKGGKFSLTGLLLLDDPLRDDIKSTISGLKSNNISVAMLTGDNRYIAQRVGEDSGIGARTTARDGMKDITPGLVQDYDVFSELLPEDKYRIVKAAKQDHSVAVTGDGVNDIPALREATVGIAVNTATDAAKSSADIILLRPGLSVIADALIESKKIIEKLHYYSIYRLSESFRVILTILIIGLALGSYPLSPIQLILLFVLNDIPIMSIAFDNVPTSSFPAKNHFNRRLKTSIALGLTGVVNSLLFLWILLTYLHSTNDLITTAFFLKLTIGGHMLLLVARTKKAWFKSLPSHTVLTTLLGTQLLASVFALTGFLMPKIPFAYVALVWVYAFFWMQISDAVKQVANSRTENAREPIL